MAITLLATVGVQPTVFQSGSGVSAPINTTGANFLLAFTMGQGTFLPTDSMSNSWANFPPGTFTVGSIAGYCGQAGQPPLVNASHTIQATGGYSPGVLFSAWSGMAATAVFDKETAGTSVTGTSLATGSITPSQNNSLIIACLGGSWMGTPSIDSGFTIFGTPLPNVPAANPNGVAWAYLFQATPAAVNPTWSWTGGSSANAAKILAYKATAAAGAAQARVCIMA